MATNKKIITTDLDFDQIKTNLKEFLKGQTEFQDYDFEGSGMSIMLDILAYNTHYNALYNNLSVNESFLDSASKRSSVVSLAKNLGYIPKSATCAKAVVDVIVRNTSTTPITLTLPKTLNLILKLMVLLTRFIILEMLLLPSQMEFIHFLI